MPLRARRNPKRQQLERVVRQVGIALAGTVQSRGRDGIFVEKPVLPARLALRGVEVVEDPAPLVVVLLFDEAAQLRYEIVFSRRTLMKFASRWFRRADRDRDAQIVSCVVQDIDEFVDYLLAGVVVVGR